MPHALDSRAAGVQRGGGTRRILAPLSVIATYRRPSTRARLFTHGTITGLLFMLAGSVYERTHTRQIAGMGSLAPRMLLLATIFVIAGLASLGLLGLSGFVAELAVFVGSFQVIPVLTVLDAAGIVVTAGYMLLDAPAGVLRVARPALRRPEQRRRGRGGAAGGTCRDHRP